MLFKELENEGIFTQNTCCDSASFRGMPSTVIFILLGSAPRIRKFVYPIPVPDSEDWTREGVKLRRYPMS
jgi:hypothetical protein